MRILIVLPGLSIGGTEKMVYHLAVGLKRRNHTVQVVALKSQEHFGRKLQAAGVNVRLLGTPEGFLLGLNDGPRIIQNLREIAEDFKPDIVHSFLSRANVLTRLAYRKSPMPIVCSLRVMEKEKKFHLLAEQLFKNVTFTVNSDALRLFAMKEMNLAENQIKVIYNGVERTHRVLSKKLRTLRKQYKLKTQTPLLLAAGRLHPQKGFDILLNAFKQIRTVFPQAYLVIAGEGTERASLNRKIAQLGLKESVDLPGVVDLAPYFKLATLFVLSSRWEGMPNVVLESVAAGCPVVATNAGGVKEIIPTSKEGLVVPAENVPALRDAIIEAIDNPGEALERALIAKKRLESIPSFSVDRMVKDYIDLYQDLLEKRLH